jgi:hypothetical protein
MKRAGSRKTLSCTDEPLGTVTACSGVARKPRRRTAGTALFI